MDKRAKQRLTGLYIAVWSVGALLAVVFAGGLVCPDRPRPVALDNVQHRPDLARQAPGLLGLVPWNVRPPQPGPPSDRLAVRCKVLWAEENSV